MSITFGEARQQVAQYAGKGGKCWDDPSVELFLKQVLDYLLISNQHGNTRKFTFNAVRGIFTLPYELETALKIKIDGEVGSSWDKWFEWYTQGDFPEKDCLQANSFSEEPGYFPTVFDLPTGGAHVAVTSVCCEDENAFVIVKGTDLTGREIITQHKGKTIVGEFLQVEKGQLKYTATKFGSITQVLKSPTKGYTQLLWYYPESDTRGFLSDYSPLEEKPSYRRVRIKTRCAEIVKVSVLGRIRLKEKYTDTDEIPFNNAYTLVLAAQAINADYNKDIQLASAKDVRMQDLIGRENSSKTPQVGQPIEVYKPLSGGSIRGIVGSSYGRRGYR